MISDIVVFTTFIWFPFDSLTCSLNHAHVPVQLSVDHLYHCCCQTGFYISLLLPSFDNITHVRKDSFLLAVRIKNIIVIHPMLMCSNGYSLWDFLSGFRSLILSQICEHITFIIICHRLWLHIIFVFTLHNDTYPHIYPFSTPFLKIPNKYILHLF